MFIQYFQQADFDQLLVNLRMDAVYVKENMRIRWQSETGMLETMPKMVKEYKESRGLMVRTLILTHKIVRPGMRI